MGLESDADPAMTAQLREAGNGRRCSRVAGFGDLHPWQLKVGDAGWPLGDRELQMRERERERRTGKGGREGEGAKGPGQMDEGDAVVVEVPGGDGADEDAAAAHLKMMMGEGVLD